MINKKSKSNLLKGLRGIARRLYENTDSLDENDFKEILGSMKILQGVGGNVTGLYMQLVVSAAVLLDQDLYRKFETIMKEYYARINQRFASCGIVRNDSIN
jgi:hypothetical protein